MSSRVEMSDDEFQVLSELIHDYSGINFDRDKKYLLQRRLAPRLVATGARNFAEYAWQLRYGGRGRRELEEAVDRVAVNETYFFREDYQLRAFSDEILPELRWQPGRERRLSIWSAGCSTGEEPYSIAITVLEHSPFFGQGDFKVLATDLANSLHSFTVTPFSMAF